MTCAQDNSKVHQCSRCLALGQCQGKAAGEPSIKTVKRSSREPGGCRTCRRLEVQKAVSGIFPTVVICRGAMYCCTFFAVIRYCHQEVATSLCDLCNTVAQSNPRDGHLHAFIRYQLSYQLIIKLKGEDATDKVYLGGLRRAFLSLKLLPSLVPIGLKIATNFEAVQDGLQTDQQDHAYSEMQGLVYKAFAPSFDSLYEVQGYLGADPLLSPIRVISKISSGKPKPRIVFVSTSSGISVASSNVECVQLYLHWSLLDVVMDALGIRNTSENIDMHFLVLHFADAFFQVPMLFTEQRFFTTCAKSKHVFWIRVAQGFRAGPLLWARVVAQVVLSVYTEHSRIT
eukprot:5046041-Amphidinium_carterae.6